MYHSFPAIQLVIRSHEGPDARDKRSDLGGMDVGYTIDHVVESGKLITLFSAPDYPQFQVTLCSLLLQSKAFPMLFSYPTKLTNAI